MDKKSNRKKNEQRYKQAVHRKESANGQQVNKQKILIHK